MLNVTVKMLTVTFIVAWSFSLFAFLAKNEGAARSGVLALMVSLSVTLMVSAVYFLRTVGGRTPLSRLPAFRPGSIQSSHLCAAAAQAFVDLLVVLLLGSALAAVWAIPSVVLQVFPLCIAMGAFVDFGIRVAVLFKSVRA